MVHCSLTMITQASAPNANVIFLVKVICVVEFCSSSEHAVKPSKLQRTKVKVLLWRVSLFIAAFFIVFLITEFMEFVMLVSANDTTMTAHKLSDIRSVFPR